MNALEQAIVYRLQEDLPLVSRPYGVIAEELGISENELMERLTSLSEAGIIRRFGAIVDHRKSGFAANPMVVWKVPEEKITTAGKVMASYSEVSHCYHRSSSSQDWPYNMYTMIHGQTPEQCEDIICRMANDIGVTEYELLYSSRELKKCSMKYFAESQK